MTAFTRSAIFTGGGLCTLVILQMFAFDLSAIAEPGRLRSPIVMFMALMFTIGITGTAGAAAAFISLRRPRVIPTASLLLLGSVFGAAAFAAFVPALNRFGAVIGGVLYVLLAACIAFLGMHVLAAPSPGAGR